MANDIVKALRAKEKTLTQELKRIGKMIVLAGGEVKRKVARRKRHKAVDDIEPTPAKEERGTSSASPSSSASRSSSRTSKPKKGRRPGIATARSTSSPSDAAAAPDDAKLLADLDEREAKRKRAEELKKK